MKTKEWDGSEYLVCNRCGHKDNDVGLVLMHKRMFPGMKTELIPYLCRGCIEGRGI